MEANRVATLGRVAMPKLPKFLSKSKKTLFNPETKEWLLSEGDKKRGEKLVAYGEEILDDKKNFNREKLVAMYLISRKNWEIAMGEIQQLERKVKRLELEVKILREE